MAQFMSPTKGVILTYAAQKVRSPIQGHISSVFNEIEAWIQLLQRHQVNIYQLVNIDATRLRAASSNPQAMLTTIKVIQHIKTRLT